MADGTTRTTRADGTPVLTYCGIGTMATHQVVPVTSVVPMPEGVPHEVAALIGCGVSTGVGAVLKTAAVPPASTVAIIGLGGVGLSCVMGAVLASAWRIVAVDTNPAKLALARELGATETVLADPADPAGTVAAIKDAAGDGGPDYAFEAIGLPATMAQAVECLPPGGTAVLVGMPAFGERVSFEDRVLGPSSGVVDDFVVRRNDGAPAYNLAVVVDDTAQGVGEVVRGADLLESTPRQLLLARLLGAEPPVHAHVPLVLGDDGARLAKRHGSVTLADRLALGETAGDVLAWMAATAGLAEPGERPSSAELAERFDPAKLPREPTIFKGSDPVKTQGV